MDLKYLKQLVDDIQSQHHAKVALEKELASGQLEFEGLMKRRDLQMTSVTSMSQVNKDANALVLNIAKFYFSQGTGPQSRLQSPVKASKRAQSPPFLCGVSPSRRAAGGPHKDSRSELIELKSEAEKLLSDYYVKYGN